MFFKKKSKSQTELERDRKELEKKHDDENIEEVQHHLYAIVGALAIIDLAAEHYDIDLDLSSNSINKLSYIINELAKEYDIDEDLEDLINLSEMLSGYFSIVAIKNIENLEFEVDDENYFLNSLKNIEIDETYEVQSILFHQLANSEPLIDAIEYYENIKQMKNEIFVDDISENEENLNEAIIASVDRKEEEIESLVEFSEFICENEYNYRNDNFIITPNFAEGEYEEIYLYHILEEDDEEETNGWLIFTEHDLVGEEIIVKPDDFYILDKEKLFDIYPIIFAFIIFEDLKFAKFFVDENEICGYTDEIDGAEKTYSEITGHSLTNK